MSGAARILTVAGKEVLDTIRDRRAMLVTLLTAIAAGPVFLVLIFNMTASQADKARELKLPVVGQENAPALIAFLERSQVVIQTAPADYETKIRAGELDVALWIDPAFEADVASGKAGTVR
jgi:sodium transport system permease protein